MASGKILLLEDVHGLGKKGDIVKAAAGYIRNFLLPKRRAVVASNSVLALQEKLKKEREEQAAVDQRESEALASRLKDVTLVIERKADQDGHMYGSVSTLDLVKLLNDTHNIELDKHFIHIPKPIKAFGVHKVELALKEGVQGELTVKILAEGHPEQVEEASASDQTEEASE